MLPKWSKKLPKHLKKSTLGPSMASGAPNMLQQRLQDTILEHLGPMFDVFSRNIERFSDHLQWIAQVAGGHREANRISRKI